MKRYILSAASCSCLFLSSVVAGTVGTRTFTNANHAGMRGASGNTIALFSPGSAGSVVRRIDYTGSLTKVASATWAREARISPTGTGLAASQNWIQFSNVQDYTGTLPVSGTVYAPGGFPGQNLIQFEHYDIVDDNGAATADSRSTITHTFDNSYGPAGNWQEYSGALGAGDPTYNRVFFTFEFVLSAVGTSVYHDVQPFFVDADGTYTIASASGYNNYLSLYASAFDPANPLSGVQAVNDEAINVLRGNQFAAIPTAEDSGGTSRIDVALHAGTQYYAVTSSFSNGQGGAYTNLIVGPGGVAMGLVPEPAIGLISLVLLSTRRLRRAG